MITYVIAFDGSSYSTSAANYAAKHLSSKDKAVLVGCYKASEPRVSAARFAAHARASAARRSRCKQSKLKSTTCRLAHKARRPVRETRLHNR